MMRRFFDEATSLGGLVFYILVAVLLFVSNRTADAYSAIYALFFMYITITLIRTFFFRERPQRREHNSYLQRIDASSFPSLHASRATYLFVLFLSIFTFGIFTFALGLLYLTVLYSRIYLKKHFISDVIGGVVLGAISYLIFNRAGV